MAKKIKTTSILLGTGLTVLMIGGWVASAYALVHFAELPIDLPGKPADSSVIGSDAYDEANYPSEGYKIARQWEDVVIYKPKVKISTVDEIIDIVELPEITEDELFVKLGELDESSLLQFITKNPNCIENGYEKIFVDLVDKNNTDTGLRTKQGDKVLSIDAINSMMIAGRDIETPSGTCNIKIAIVKDKSQLDLSIADNMSIWELAETHAEKSGALLVTNANGYVWHESGSYATLYGALKYNGELIRRPNDEAQIVTISEDGTLDANGDIETALHAVEMGPILIDEGEVVYSIEEGTAEDRYAQTAIGQCDDGTTIIVVAAGSTYGANVGATYSEILQIMQDYGCTEASMLSGGSRSVMYYNGRVVNETIGYNDTGVRLPSAIIVRPNQGVIDMATETINNKTEENRADNQTTDKTNVNEVEANGADTGETSEN